MTALSTLMSVILMPANLLLYCNAAYNADVVESIDFNSLFLALTVVISAIGLGLVMSAKVHSYRFNIFANKVCHLFSFRLYVLNIFPSFEFPHHISVDVTSLETMLEYH